MDQRQHLFTLPLGLLLYVQSSLGQQVQLLQWTTLQLPVQLLSSWQVHNDNSYRTIDITASAYQYTFRTGIRRFINNKWNVATGLAFFFTQTSFDKTNHEFEREFRLWQEVVKENKLNKKLSLLNRIRTEERFFSATEKREKSFGIRLRYKLAIVHAISPKWKIQLANEYMRQINSKEFAFQQNRLAATAIFSVNISTQLQDGYIWSKLATSTQHFITCTFIKTIIANGVSNKK